MRSGESQTRVLAILFISAAVGFAYWQGDFRRDVARQLGHDIGRELNRDFGRDVGTDLSRDLGRDVARLKLPPNVIRLGPTPATGPRPSTGATTNATSAASPLSTAASSHTDTIPGYGMLLPRNSDSVAGFNFVTLIDSSTSLAALGFISATRLLDTASRFEPFGDERGLPRVRVASRSRLDAGLRAQFGQCAFDVSIPVQPALPAHGSWIMALVPGAAEVLPSSLWRIETDSVDRTGEALRLARSLTTDTTRFAGSERAAALAAVPLRLVTLHHFVADGAEIMVVETHRSSRQATDTANGPTLEEHRLLIAERAVLDKIAAYRVVWHQTSTDDPDQLATERPHAMIRLGEARTLTLLTEGHYRDGAGGLFVARIGRARWKTVASWYSGC
jgi:hypothetical protein